MKGRIAALAFAAAAAFFGAHAHAAEGDYVVVLKHAPVSLMSAEDDTSVSTNVFVVDSFMDALNFAPASEIDCIFPDGIAYLLDDEELVAPVNDPRYFDEWHLQKTNASYAWGKGYTGRGVKVGIVDSGMKRPSHADLPTPNSFYNILSGSDYTDYGDSYGHGTKVAGIIGAIANNSVGMCGIAYNAELIPVKVTEGKTLYTSDMLTGFETAVKLGCDVVNMSLGFTTATSSQATVDSVRKRVEAAADNGVITVAAAGNAGITEYQYPASYDCVVSVASSGRAKTSDDAGKGYAEDSIMDLRADGSGYTYRTFLPDEPSTFTQHNDQVTVSAPGYQIFSTTYTGGYTRSDGTSFASPVVAGAAAIAKQIDPDITVYDFIEALRETSRDVYTEGYDEYTGFGVLDIQALTDYLAARAPERTVSPEPTETPEPTATPETSEAPTATSVASETPSATPEPVTTVTYNGKYTVTAVYDPAPVKTKVYFAFFRGGRLVALKSNGVVEGSTSTSITYPSAWDDDVEDDIDYIEIFIWDSEFKPSFGKQLIQRSDRSTDSEATAAPVGIE